jgi:hypothetical protein
MRDIDLGSLAQGPQANLIRDMASQCSADSSIQAMWVGGSLAAGLGDSYSDVDFRIAAGPGQLDKWTGPDWEQYLPILPCGGLLMRFGEHALLRAWYMQAAGKDIESRATLHMLGALHKGLEGRLTGHQHTSLACRHGQLRIP